MRAYQHAPLHGDNLEDYVPALEGLSKGALANLLHALQLHMGPQQLLHARQRLNISLQMQKEDFHIHPQGIADNHMASTAVL